MLNGRPPYQQKNKKILLRDIVEKPIEFKPEFPSSAISLLKGLLSKNPDKRLGSGIEDSEEIKRNIFFKNIDWPLLYQKKLEAPFKPTINSPLDINYFSPDFTREDPQAETPIVTKNPFKKQKEYEGFTYDFHEIEEGLD